MAEQISDLLHRRSDLSTFLVHLTGGVDPEANLLSILRARVIEARSAYGLLREIAQDKQQELAELHESQRAVCFTETPLEHAWMMCADIADRQHPLSKFGLAVPKVWGRGVGVNPVWYVDVLRTGHDWLLNPLLQLVKQAWRDGGVAYSRPFELEGGTRKEVAFQESPIAKIAPFIEQIGPVGPRDEPRRREFAWEREWRHVGDLQFEWSDLVAVFAPAARHDSIREALKFEAPGSQTPRLLDPSWGLERMVAALAGTAPEVSGPLPWY